MHAWSVIDVGLFGLGTDVGWCPVDKTIGHSYNELNKWISNLN